MDHNFKATYLVIGTLLGTTAQAGESLMQHPSPIDLKISIGADSEINQAVDALLAAIEAGSPKIVFLGEDHQDHVVKSFYKTVISEYRQRTGKQVCYFHELKTTMQPGLDALVLGEPGIDCYENLRHRLDEDFRAVFGDDPINWRNMTELVELSQQGIKMAAVDKALTRSEFARIKKLFRTVRSGSRKSRAAANKEIDRLLFAKRNPFMARHLEEQYSALGCEIGFFSTGYQHVFPPKGTGPGVPQLLSSDFPFFRVNGASCTPPWECSRQKGAEATIFLTE